jgi:nucleoside-diphosphate-sugar epimerase
MSATPRPCATPSVPPTWWCTWRFLVTGAASAEVIRSVNVEGTLNAFRAAAAAGTRRFVYASSVAAYGFHPDNPVG